MWAKYSGQFLFAQGFQLISLDVENYLQMFRNLGIAKAGLEARRDGQEPAHGSGWADAVLVDLWCRKIGR